MQSILMETNPESIIWRRDWPSRGGGGGDRGPDKWTSSSCALSCAHKQHNLCSSAPTKSPLCMQRGSDPKGSRLVEATATEGGGGGGEESLGRQNKITKKLFQFNPLHLQLTRTTEPRHLRCIIDDVIARMGKWVRGSAKGPKEVQRAEEC